MVAVTVDPFRLAAIDKSKPLRIVESNTETTCQICDGPINWIVTLRERLGKAHPGCAGDRGWSVS